MIPKTAIGALVAIQVLAWMPAAVAEEALPELAPYQMVRSLQIVQDRIADGDHAALPMQKKMIEMIDKRLLSATREEYADRRNFEALVIYGMSGGNPKTLETVAAGLDLDEHDAALANGLVAYFKSNPGKASSLLSSLDPAKETPQIGAFLALVKGTIAALQRPERGLQLLDLARLYAPGPLVEEAALRRSISIAIGIKDRDRFLRASEQYARRFLHSPYASHFADGFINGIVGLREGIDLAFVEYIVSGMNAEQQLAIYLRIARQSAIAGYTDLAEFASAKAQRVSGNANGPEDPRAAFYNALASVTTQPVEEVARRLDAIDRSTLAKRDVRLLDAAREVIRGVTASPLGSGGTPVAEAPVDTAEPAPPEQADAGNSATEAGTDRPPAPQETAADRQANPAGDAEATAPVATAAGEESAAPAKDAAAAEKPVETDAVAEANDGAAEPAPASGEPAPAAEAASGPSYDDVVSSTRKALQDIDDLLEKEKEVE